MSVPMPPDPSDGLTLAELLANPSVVDRLPPEAVPDLLGAVERLKADLWRRLTSPASPSPPVVSEGADRLLTAAEAAPLLGVTPQWLYRRARASRLPFARKLGRKTLRFSEAGLRRWAASRR